MPGKIKIVAACGAGMGTSMIIKLKLENIVRKLKLDASVDAMSAGQAKGQVAVADIIICSSHLADQFDPNQRAKIVGVVNIMSDDEIEAAVKKGL